MTKEGWLLLTIEIEANGDFLSKWKGSFLYWFVGLVVLVLELFTLPWLL
jgi:hypothetical protein